MYAAIALVRRRTLKPSNHPSATPPVRGQKFAWTDFEGFITDRKTGE